MTEYKEYRFVLEQLRERFGDKNWLALHEIAEYDGCCARTAKKRYGITGVGMDITVLAARKCELAH